VSVNGYSILETWLRASFSSWPVMRQLAAWSNAAACRTPRGMGPLIWTLPAVVVLLAGCANEAEPPVLSGVSPTSVLSHTVPLDLVYRGSGFTVDSRAVFGGQELETVFVSSSEIIGRLEPEDTLTGGGAASAEVQVLVRNDDGGESEALLFTVNHGVSFEPPVMLASGPSGMDAPWVLVDQAESVHVVWTDRTGTHHRRSWDEGQTWSDARSVSDLRLTNLAAASDGAEGLYVAGWLPGSSPAGGLFIVWSRDGGDSWSSPVATVNDRPDAFIQTYMAVHAGGPATIAWGEGPDATRQIYVTSSDDGASAWSSRTFFAAGRGPHLTATPDGAMNLVWDFPEGDYLGAAFTRSLDGGRTWADRVRIDSGHAPDIASTSDGYLFVLYVGGSTGLTSRSSQNNGATWTAQVDLPIGPAGSTHVPEADIDDYGNAHAAWMGRGGGSDSFVDAGIYCSRGPALGRLWSEPVAVSTQAGIYLYPGPHIAANSVGRAFVVWAAESNGQHYLYFARSAE
jgi:hypothetical protein